MTEPVWVTTAAAEYRAGRPLALLFDFDGTLSPIVPHPSQALLPAAARDALATLAALTDVKVGVLSGRPLAQLKRLVDLPGVWFAGSGGMHLDLGGTELQDETLGGFDAIAEPLSLALGEVLRWFRGAWIERKPGCLTAHYRALSPPEAELFLAEARDALAGLDPDCPPLQVLEADCGLEIALAGSWSKGEAVARMLAAWGCEPLPLYAGNSANDEAAILRVNGLGGLTVRVGPEPAAAKAHVASPQELSDCLWRLAAALAAVELPGSRSESNEAA